MPFIRRRPLLRTAVVGGGAYYAGSKRAQSKAQEEQAEAQQNQQIQELQQQQAQQQAAVAQAPPPTPAAPAAPAAAASTDDLFTQLKQLGELHDSGILTDEEFAAEKAKILNQ